MPPQLINIALKLKKFVMSIVAIFGKVLSNMILSVGVIPGDFALRGFPSVPSPFQGLPCNNTWYLKKNYFFSFYWHFSFVVCFNFFYYYYFRQSFYLSGGCLATTLLVFFSYIFFLSFYWYFSFLVCFNFYYYYYYYFRHPFTFPELPCNNTPGPGCTFAFAFIQSARQQVKLHERQGKTTAQCTMQKLKNGVKNFDKLFLHQFSTQIYQTLRDSV